MDTHFSIVQLIYRQQARHSNERPLMDDKIGPTGQVAGAQSAPSSREHVKLPIVRQSSRSAATPARANWPRQQVDWPRLQPRRRAADASPAHNDQISHISARSKVKHVGRPLIAG